MSSFRDLTGMRFGRLVAIERDYDFQKEHGIAGACWKCKCDCGKIVVKRSPNLLNGKSKSCGCLRGEIGNKAFLYSIGQRIDMKHGSFTILNTFRKKREGNMVKDKMYLCLCNNCGEKNTIKESTLQTNVGSCKACSETRSSGEKFVYWFLKQCNICFKVEFSPSWAGRYRYDYEFEKDGNKYLIELDGGQHYGKGLFPDSRRKSYKEVDNDKTLLAEKNGYILIRINCDITNGMFVVDEIKKSVLSAIFDLSDIDWGKCFAMSLTKKSKAICDSWNNGNKSTKEVSAIVGTAQNHASKVLAQCAKFGLCDYDSDYEKRLGQKRNTKAGKAVRCLDNKMQFKSCEECSRQSDALFGVHLTSGGITRVCRGERSAYKGFHFEYL